MHKLLQKKSCLFSTDSIDKLVRYGELKVQNFEKLVLFTIIPNWYVLEQYGTSDGPLFCPICGRGVTEVFFCTMYWFGDITQRLFQILHKVKKNLKIK